MSEPVLSRQDSATRGRRGPPPAVLGIVAAVVAGALLVPALRASDWNPTLLVAFGEDATESLAYAESLLDDVDARAGLGHDGKYYFTLAVDPWISDPATMRAVLDPPLYRAQRILYPWLAGFFGLAPPGLIVWMLLVVNLVSLAVGTAVTGVVARRMGGSSLWGLAFALNLGVFSELLVSGAGIVALCAAMLGVMWLQAGRTPLAVSAIAASALSREVMLLCAAGVAWWLWRQGARRVAVSMIGVPILAVGMWALYLRVRLGWDPGGEQLPNIGVPFRGLVESIGGWLERPLDLAVALFIIVVLTVLAVRTVQRGWLVGWMALGFVPLAAFLTDEVWTSFFDISRAIAPAITAFILVAFAGRGRSTEHQLRAGGVA